MAPWEIGGRRLRHSSAQHRIERHAEILVLGIHRRLPFKEPRATCLRAALNSFEPATGSQHQATPRARASERILIGSMTAPELP